MYKITETMEYEGSAPEELKTALREFYELSPFATGIDWQWQLLWATMTDEQYFAFCLKHPEYTERFKRI